MNKIPYSSVIGSLIYCMVCTRPNLAHVMSVINRFMANPGNDHWAAVKRIFRYLKGSINMALVYGGATIKEKLNILGFTDTDYAIDLNKRRLSTGYVFKLCNSTISWKTNLQSAVALSTTDAECIAITEAIKEALRLKLLVSELLEKKC